MIRIMIAGVLALAAMAAPAFAQAPQANYADVIEKLRPSLVLIKTITVKPASPWAGSPELEKFLGSKAKEDPRESTAYGSGFVYDATQGLIVTTNYVLDDAARIEVTLPNGSVVEGKKVGSDEVSGVALLRIPPAGLVNVTWAPRRLRAGEPLLVLANFYGTGQFATSGMMGAPSPNMPQQSADFFLMDAVVHKGAAGGLVADSSGAVIGMAYAQFGSSYDAPFNAGVAIHASEVRRIAALLAKDGKIARGAIGVTLEDQTFPNETLIAEVTKGSPAERAGLKVDDTLVKIAGIAVFTSDQARKIVAKQSIGAMLPITVKRDGKVMDFAVQVEASP